MPDPAQNLDDGDQIDDNQIDDNQVDDHHIDDEPQISEAQQKAMDLGWVPKDKWEGDEDNWNSAPNFLRTREIIDNNKALRAEQDKMRHDFDKRIENNNKLSQQMMDMKVSELKGKRDAAAADADMPAYQDANKQLDEIEKSDVSRETPPPANTENYAKAVYDHPVTQQFITENPWIRGGAPKAIYGQKIFADYIQQNPTGTIEEGLELVKTSVNREFPQVNQNRQNAKQMGDRGNGPKKIASKNTLTMDDLTSQERAIFSGLGSGWKDEKDFLQAVADNRKGG